MIRDLNYRPGAIYVRKVFIFVRGRSISVYTTHITRIAIFDRDWRTKSVHEESSSLLTNVFDGITFGLLSRTKDIIHAQIVKHHENIEQDLPILWHVWGGESVKRGNKPRRGDYPIVIIEVLNSTIQNVYSDRGIDAFVIDEEKHTTAEDKKSIDYYMRIAKGWVGSHSYLQLP